MGRRKPRSSGRGNAISHAGPLLAALDRRFEAVVFDWDGTAVPDRAADATEVRGLVEALCGLGMEIVVVSGTHVGNVDGQLLARPGEPGHLHLCLNRGSEVFAVEPEGPSVVESRRATDREDRALTAAAELTLQRLSERGLEAAIVSQRLNRRKIDVIPLPEWAEPPKAGIDELVVAVDRRVRKAGFNGLPEVVELAMQAAREAGVPDPRVTTDAKHVEIGVTDKTDSARWIARYLAGTGIGPGQVLLAGDEMGPLGGLPGSDSLMLVPDLERATVISVGVEPSGVPPGVMHIGGGPSRFLGVLGDQLQRRREGAPPQADDDPAWSIAIARLDREFERTHESLLTIADGRLGTNGSPLLAHPAARPEVLASGGYDGVLPESQLMPAPLWERLSAELPSTATVRRSLDLRAGLLAEAVVAPHGTLVSARFSSLANPGLTVLRVTADPELVPRGPAVVDPNNRESGRRGPGGGKTMSVQSPAAVISAAALERRSPAGPAIGVERIVAYAAGAPDEDTVERATAALAVAAGDGFERLWSDHRAAWGRRWREADVRIPGDPELQVAVRFALFHLMSSVADTGEAAVGARGLSGSAYAGHVFWDADVFVLPFLAATHPEAARAMLEYRLRRLPAALEAAKASGRQGARFPWESAASGRDVTPRSAPDLTGRVVPIRTGQLEEHIVADVAWAASVYADWSGDDAFVSGPGLPLTVETARYWASRVRFDACGGAHIYRVIGPDEYHEPVDDNAFTNVMARWNLRRAVRLTEGGTGGATDFERLRWIEVADSLVDGYDPHTGLYEQCAGFFGLEPLVISEIAPRRPITADLLFGRDRVRGSQIVKQADVLMLHHIVPEETAAGSLRPNLEYYEPRTAHGSSLSPGVHAALFARLGMLNQAVNALDLAARMDLDDLSGTTASGLHLATMGSLWQALAWGFAGMQPEGSALRVDPHVPEAWGALDMRVRFRGCPLVARLEPDRIVLQADGTIGVRVGKGGPATHVGREGAQFQLRDARWRRVSR